MTSCIHTLYALGYRRQILRFMEEDLVNVLSWVKVWASETMTDSSMSFIEHQRQTLC